MNAFSGKRWLSCVVLALMATAFGFYVPGWVNSLPHAFEAAQAQGTSSITSTRSKPAGTKSGAFSGPTFPAAPETTEAPVAPEAPARPATSTAPEPSVAQAASADSGADSIYFYAMMQPTGPIPPKLQNFLKKHPEVRSQLGYRPMLQWAVWANKPKPFLPSLAFILVFALVDWALFPHWMSAAQTYCRERYWSTFWVGTLILGIAIWMVRMSVITLFNWPMGMFLGGLLQFISMAGLSVVVSMIGQTLAVLLKISKWSFIGQREDAYRFAYLLLGALACSVLLQIPGIGDLPRIGPRLVGLLAILGFGGIFRARPQGKTN